MDLKTNSRCTSDCETCYKFESPYIFTPGESGYVVIGEIKNKDRAYCSWSMGYEFESYQSHCWCQEGTPTTIAPLLQ